MSDTNDRKQAAEKAAFFIYADKVRMIASYRIRRKMVTKTTGTYK